MSIDVAQLLKLDINERLRLVEILWDSLLAEEDKVPLAQWQQEELDRRLDQYERNPEEGRPWEEVKARLLARDG